LRLRLKRTSINFNSNFTKEKEMADFRKWLLVLVVLAFAASIANAQPFTCQVSAGSAPIVRHEGISELVGDILLSCEGGTATQIAASPIRANVQLFLSAATNVTSRLYDNDATEALLLIDEPGPNGAIQQDPSNTFQGDLAGPNSIVWLDVPISVGGPASIRTIRLTNVRVDATPLPIQGTVSATVSISSSPSIQVNNPQVIVGTVLPGMDRDDTTVDDAGSDVGDTFQQCVGLNLDLAGDADESGGEAGTFQIDFREGFATAFKPVGGADGNPGSPAGGQVDVGLLYNTESGLILDATAQGVLTGFEGVDTIGQADQGTRLFARFSNVPEGVRIFVTESNIAAGPTAVLVSQDDTEGGGGDTPTPLNDDGATGDFPGMPGLAMDEVDLSGGEGVAVWEVTAANPFATETVSVGMLVAFPENLEIETTPTTSATVSLGFAPLSDDHEASDSPIPRFIDESEAIDVFQIAACVTNLLFPFVSNQSGFDTGLAVVNTSLDNATGSSGTPPDQPFKTTPQEGTCTFYYFGSMEGGGALPAPQTSEVVPAGSLIKFALSTGGVPNATSSTEGFEGYVIVRCNFQFAHGFAFINDAFGGNNIAHGYLALIIPDPARDANPFPGAGVGSGEQLGY
jgi:hypothetical protein